MSCTRAGVVAVQVQCVLLAATLSKQAIVAASGGRRARSSSIMPAGLAALFIEAELRSTLQYFLSSCGPWLRHHRRAATTAAGTAKKPQHVSGGLGHTTFETVRTVLSGRPKVRRRWRGRGLPRGNSACAASSRATTAAAFRAHRSSPHHSPAWTGCAE